MNEWPKILYMIPFSSTILIQFRLITYLFTEVQYLAIYFHCGIIKLFIKCFDIMNDWIAPVQGCQTLAIVKLVSVWLCVLVCVCVRTKFSEFIYIMNLSLSKMLISFVESYTSTFARHSHFFILCSTHCQSFCSTSVEYFLLSLFIFSFSFFQCAVNRSWCDFIHFSYTSGNITFFFLLIFHSWVLYTFYILREINHTRKLRQPLWHPQTHTHTHKE